ncbi:MAG: BtrH N-terminal domain-containing protein [Lachnospiraceae bacterium]|nr:BtrH N-terminal domain-containing protein [Lachnospiraceae bacterium]
MLKVDEPLIRANQGSSYIQAIIMAHENISDMVLINYTNLYCSFEDNYENIDLEFTNSSWEYYRSIGLADMNLFHRKFLSPEKFGDFLKERIDQNNYLLLYSVDEFYLPYTQYYMSRHYEHDAYIYGYEDTDFFAMGYLNDMLQTIRVKQVDIINAFFSSYLEDNTSFCTFKINENVYVKSDIDMILDSLEKYMCESRVDEIKQLATGTGVYDVIDKYLEHFIDCHLSREKIDLKIFRTIWEHKKMLCVKFQEQHIIKHESQNSLYECERDALAIFRMSLKFMKSGEEDILNSMRSGLKRLRTKEFDVIKGIINEIHLYLNTS